METYASDGPLQLLHDECRSPCNHLVEVHQLNISHRMITDSSKEFLQVFFVNFAYHNSLKPEVHDSELKTFLVVQRIGQKDWQP